MSQEQAQQAQRVGEVEMEGLSSSDPSVSASESNSSEEDITLVNTSSLSFWKRDKVLDERIYFRFVTKIQNNSLDITIHS